MKKVKEFFEQNIKEIIITLFVFLVFLILFRIAPMMYDGWGGKLYYSQFDGFVSFLINIFKYNYIHLNGRVSINIISGILESFKSEWVLDIFNSLTFVAIFLFIFILIKVKDKKKKFIWAFLFFMSMILLISSDMRIEVLFYASTTYITPIFLILLFYYFYQKFINKQYKKENTIILYMSIISFMICTWIEHIALGFLVVLFSIVVFMFIKNNKKKFKMCIPLLTALGGFLLMFLSPGLRASRVIIPESNTSVIIANNITKFYIDIISNNIFLIFLLALFGIIIFVKNRHKYFSNYLLLIDSILIVILSFYKIIMKYISINYFDIIINKIFPNNVPSNICILLLFIFLILSLILGIIVNSENKKFLFYIAFITLFSLGPLCITPNSGSRISSIGFFALVIILTIIYFEISKVDMKSNKILNIVATILVLISLDHTILLERRIYEVNVKRERILKNVLIMQELGKWDYNEYVFLPLYNEGDLLYRGEVYNDSIYFGQFIMVYGLSADTKIYRHPDLEIEVP